MKAVVRETWEKIVARKERENVKKMVKIVNSRKAARNQLQE